jgi:hypothetical protein
MLVKVEMLMKETVLEGPKCFLILFNVHTIYTKLDVGNLSEMYSRFGLKCALKLWKH